MAHDECTAASNVSRFLGESHFERHTTLGAQDTLLLCDLETRQNKQSTGSALNITTQLNRIH